MAAFFTGYLAQGVGTAGSWVENTASGYVRQACTLNTLYPGTSALAIGVTFPAISTAIVVTQRALYDASSGGNLVMWWTVSSAKSLPAQTTDTLVSGELMHTYPDIAEFSGLNGLVWAPGSKIGTTSSNKVIYAGVAAGYVAGAVGAATVLGLGGTGGGTSFPGGTGLSSATGSLVSIGGGLTLAGGALSSTGTPIATASTVGTVQPDNTTITVNGSGVISATGGGGGSVSSVATGTGLTGGPITSSGTVSLAAIASNDLLANITGSSAAPVATSLSAVIDAAIGSTQGDILYRGASTWSVLAPGTSGYVLSTGGSAANPSWVSQSGSSNTGAIISTGSATTMTTNILEISSGVTFPFLVTLPTSPTQWKDYMVYNNTGSVGPIQLLGTIANASGTVTLSSVGAAFTSFWDGAHFCRTS